MKIKEYTIPIVAGLLQTAANQIEDVLLNDNRITEGNRELLKKLYRSTQTSSCLANQLSQNLKTQKEKIK